ncbi:Origin recognition complex subunit 6 [Fusarium austroafricanum]|uniref:Origin recognition complex subunit 6 n=1 Tax=Fusarium austroafricanum TaxID=2364996 RepID=A0A8H4KBP8_9HYPO|nr:Origin recognition complex subunit 6 [Fusarium austroafricanum]
MSRQIEQALLSLMPTYGSDLPPSLVELAGSLLAQSRHRASTLKAEEEIARLYACANIACDRLKITLDLPPIEPRPPIPPRIYKRLYTHLDNILPSGASTPSRATAGRTRTPGSRFRDADNSPASGSRPLPSRGTPTKEQSLAQWRTPSKGATGTPTRSTRKKEAFTGDNLHAWIQPATRWLCEETDHKKLAPTILAGMETIVTPGGRRTDDEWVLQNVTALFAAIYFFVTMRVKALASGEGIDREGYVPLRKEILALLSRTRKEVIVRDLEDENAWEGWSNLKSKDFDDAVAQINERAWLTGDWYQGIADVVKLTQRTHLEDVEMLDEETMPKMQVKKADTMFQDKYDFLSEAKRTSYMHWKEDMFAKIALLTTTKGAAMEVDT